MSNKGPYVTVGLSKEQFDFLLENCESNIGMGLNILTEVQAGRMSMRTAEKAVTLMEKFKGVRSALKDAEKGQI